MKKLFLIIGLANCYLSLAQNDTIYLSDLVVSDTFLEQQNKTQNITKLNDSVIANNAKSLTELLNLNTLIYFKENGYGMVSSPSFRGTTAQQTGVYWNGIPINSKFLGQSDFNAVNTSNYNQIAVKSGGGSTIYGSGAIGGSIHLGHKIDFKDKFSHDLKTSYGSFNTFNTNYSLDFAHDNWSVNGIYSYANSTNDYEVEELNFKNQNGSFYNHTASLNLGYKINSNHKILAFTQYYKDQRHFPILEPSQTKTKYQNNDFRGTVQWKFQNKRLKSNLQTAVLTEEYTYFPNINKPKNSGGNIITKLIKGDVQFQINDMFKTSFLSEFSQNNAEGRGSGIPKIIQNQVNFATLISGQLSPNFFVESGIRYDLAEDYESPILFSVGSSYRLNKWLNYKFNFSKNFRIPTFNDRYWQPGGNPNLKAETALQYEITQNIKLNNTALSLTFFRNEITDMIRWLPTHEEYWAPFNTDRVSIFGLELMANYHKKIGSHNIKLNANYGYTHAKNKANDKFLMFVPKHKATLNLSHNYINLTLFIQNQLTGEIFTRSDNEEKYNLGSYFISNLGINYKINQYFEVGAYIKNLTNSIYKNVIAYPMPKRNYQLKLNIKI